MTESLTEIASPLRRLNEMKARLQAELHHVREGDGHDAGIGSDNEFDPNHPADMATEMFEREMSETLSENVEELLHKVQRAIARIDDGSYGLCEDCGQAITPARLEAVPYASYCITCQVRQEP